MLLLSSHSYEMIAASLGIGVEWMGKSGAADLAPLYTILVATHEFGGGLTFNDVHRCSRSAL
jgi:hypothetical protein